MSISNIVRILPALPFLTLLFSLAASPASAQEEEKPSLYDYGFLAIERGEFVQSGDRLCTDVTITNKGAGDLVVDAVQWRDGSYETTSARTYPVQLGPGHTVSLSVCRTGTEKDLPPDLLQVRSNTRTSTAWGIVVDVSQSMDTSCSVVWGSRLDIAKREAARAVDSVVLRVLERRIHDKFVTIAYSGTAKAPLIEMNLPFHPLVDVTGQNRGVAKDSIAAQVTIGGTWTGSALRATIDTLSGGPDSMPRKILLLTDGPPVTKDLLANPLDTVVAEANAAGVTIYALNMQAESAAEYLDSLAVRTGGSQLIIPDCDDRPDLIGELIRTLYLGQRSTAELPFPGQSPTLGVSRTEEEAGSLSLEITPNPAADHVSVTLRGAVVGDVVLEIVDAQGRVVRAGERASAGRTLRIATDDLSAGTYMLSARDRAGRSVARTFIIAR
jgi:hypothetical protein